MSTSDPVDQSTRARVERAFVPLLERLGAVPRVLVAAAFGVGVLVALVIDSVWSALVLGGAVALLCWLTYLAWPRLDAGRRAVRVVVLVALVAWVVGRVAGS